MNKTDAEEFTQMIDQIVVAAGRQIELGKALGAPQALGLTVEEWVNQIMRPGTDD